MVTLGVRLLRVGVMLTLIAALILATSFATGPAVAKPYTADGPGGEPYGTGDPTGDDLPSPTPKPTGKAAKWGGQGAVSGSQAQILRQLGASGKFGLYLRLLARLAVR
ncbi:MAG: hypothetical protein HY568_04440 [Candidatus Latescibacteria bacterium]|nr:hypothetical protein [Candidatus Latescibacterota bacterium]